MGVLRKNGELEKISKINKQEGGVLGTKSTRGCLTF